MKKRIIGALAGGIAAFIAAVAASGGANAAPCVTAEGFPCPPKVISTGTSEPGGGNVGPSEPLEPMGGYTPPPATLEELIAGLIS
ncbi:membrane protein [Gordonia phage Jalebi]|uniref:Membrane protein n=1 Tax=Gordonia phage Jalebi TaxID=2910757 RepID=A0AA49H0T3_9CAUD|nr:membrane protein [Gordonia phage Jalebi]WNM69395.1 membrane protein [Gordonia phage Sampudon]